ncbi:MAG TPA: glycosyltransferase [Solirubrobacteraceae bacterium]|nr:glycosyltransferase [Solirubrobacteraceae bacterium]
MRIAMVSEHASPLAALGGVDAGGQNVHVAALARALARRGARVVVHTRRDDPRLEARLPMAGGVEVHHIHAGPAAALAKDDLLPYMDAFAEHLEIAWRADRPDVVHSHFWMSGHAALRAAGRLGIPVAHTFHALGVVKRRYQGARDTSPPERERIERDILGRAARIIATCTDEAFELMRMGAPRRKPAVVPCGVDLRQFRPDGPAEPRPAGRRRLAVIGRLVERKGVGNAITALADLPDTDLVVAGGPPPGDLAGDREAQRLTALAQELGVADRVELRGRLRHDTLPALLRSVDAVVCVPWYEPFGIVPVEAMACGVPVVASAVGGMVDTVVDGVTGIHVPPRDPERLAATLGPLLADESRRASLGAAGVRRARKLYDWDRIAGATQEVYSGLAPHRKGRVAATARPARLGRGEADPTGRRRAGGAGAPAPTGALEHLGALADALGHLHEEAERLEAWGHHLAVRLLEGGRLLALGNGGSAAEAQHLTAELVGRYETERRPLSALCLHGDTSSLTAIANDYGVEQAFARQVRAHAREGDVLLALSTSGASPNVLAAVEAARALGVTAWALTGPRPNPLALVCDDAVCVEAPAVSTVQELHLVAAHLLCGVVDRVVAGADRAEAEPRVLL